MAKLNGVQVIDMANGEVTKIAYEGEEYAKVEDEGRRGDIGLVIDGWGSQKVGEYFEIKHISTSDQRYYAHVNGNVMEANGDVDRFIFFRNSSAKSTLNNRVDELEQRVSALEESATQAEVIEGEPKVGDKIRIVDVHPLSVRYYDKGDIFTVSRVHPKTSSHRLYVKVKETNENIFREEFEIIERSSEPTAEIGRKPNEIKNGDIVRVIKDVDGHPVGTIGERVNGDMVEANGKRYYHTKGIELITPVEHRFDK